MAVNGIFTSDAGALNERTGSLNSVLLQAEQGGNTPTFAISSGMPSSDLTDVIMSWYEEDIMYFRAEVTAIPVATGNQITVRDATWIHANMIFIAEDTGEYMMVLGVTGNVITVQRGMSNTTPTALTAGTSSLQLIGSAFEEGAERPTGHSVNPHPRTNLTQIFHTTWDITRTAQRTQYRFGDRTAKNRSHAAMVHAHEIEWSMIWGKRHTGIIDGKPFRMMDGITEQITTNIFMSPAGGLTRRAMEDYIERLYSVNVKGLPNERITYCGNVGIRAINEIARRYGEYQLVKNEKEFGIKVMSYTTPFGDLTLIPHPMMNNSPDRWAKELYSFHPGTMEVGYIDRTFEKSDTQGSASDLRDATAGTFTTELSVKLGMENCSAIMKNLAVDHYVI